MIGRQLSLPDLHAAARGTSYGGESIAGPRQTLFARLRETTENIQWRERNREAISSDTRAALAAGEAVVPPGRTIESLFNTGSPDPTYSRSVLAFAAATTPRDVEKVHEVYRNTQGPQPARTHHTRERC